MVITPLCRIEKKGDSENQFCGLYSWRPEIPALVYEAIM
jgi:hypothetical protein